MAAAKKYSTGLVVGRFQPFHKGHLYLLQKALEVADKIIIAIGSVEKQDAQNPIPFAQREQMLRQVLQKEGLADRVTKIVSLQDYPSDEQWVSELEKVAGPFEVVVGNNDWTNRVLTEAGYAALTVPDLQRDKYQGTVIRDSAKESRAWQDSVPNYLADQISTLLQ
jgi:nicotinamide-nucleotide adenylyltransferase